MTKTASVSAIPVGPFLWMVVLIVKDSGDTYQKQVMAFSKQGAIAKAIKEWKGTLA